MDTEPFEPTAEWVAQTLRELDKRKQAVIALAEAFNIPFDDQLGAATTLKEAAYQVLKTAGEPMRTKEVLAALTSQGIKVRGKRPGNTLHATMSQDKRLHLRAGEGIWELEREEQAESAAGESEAGGEPVEEAGEA